MQLVVNNENYKELEKERMVDVIIFQHSDLRGRRISSFMLEGAMCFVGVLACNSVQDLEVRRQQSVHLSTGTWQKMPGQH